MSKQALGEESVYFIETLRDVETWHTSLKKSLSEEYLKKETTSEESVVKNNIGSSTTSTTDKEEPKTIKPDR